MKIRKDMIFAILTTFCMCALMFAVIPIRSGLPYDPWADYNADDKIDIKDISSVARLFGTLNSDNLTRNVNVTNFPIDEKGNLRTAVTKATKVITVARDINVSWIVQGGTYNWTDSFETDGYSEMYVYASVTYWSFTYRNEPSSSFNSAYYAYGQTDDIEANFPMDSGLQGQEIVYDYNGVARNMTGRFAVWSPSTRIQLHTWMASGLSTGWALFSVSVYLRS